jgi:Starter unit:ACP transacylase in aflatoxin biosynthesis
MDSKCEDGRNPFAEDADAYLVGLCTGALTAAAISSSKQVSDLLTIAPHTVGIAFRAGFRAYEVGESVEQAKGQQVSWCFSITGFSAEKASRLLDEYCNGTVS